MDVVVGEPLVVCTPHQFYDDACLPDKNENGVTYYYDGGYILNVPDGMNKITFNDTQVRRPSQLVVALDGLTPLGITSATPGIGALTTKNLLDMHVDLRHDDAVNALFADGHVKHQTTSQLLTRSKWTLSGTDVQPTPLPWPTFAPLPH